MLRNYLTIALRTLRQHPGYAAINVTGLAVGMAACLLIGLFVRSEWTFDAFHTKSDRIARAWVHEQYEDRSFTNTFTPLPLGPRLAERFPEVEASVRLRARTDLVRQGDTQFRERIHLADSGFFDVFDFPLVQGNPATALDQPGSIVLTEAIAQKYFGDANPMGQQLEIRDGDALQSFTVTGVAKAPPVNSSIQFEMIAPFQEERFGERARTSWFNVYVETYVLLRDGASIEVLQDKLPAMVTDAIGAEEVANSNFTVGLQPITDIHLNTALPAGLEPTSDPTYSYILAGIALLVLLIACINFMTLSVGRSAERAQEVGVRKVMGASRRQLMRQFWGEAFVTTGLALVAGLTVARIALPAFNDLAGHTLAFDLGGWMLLVLGGLLLVVGVVAGGYPAAVLSSLQPTEVLKGMLRISDRSALRRALVAVQFALSIFLLASLFVMMQQLGYLQSKNLGFDKEQVVTVPTTGSFAEGLRTAELVRTELMGEPGIVEVGASAFTPDRPWMTVEFADGQGGFYTYRANLVTHDYVEAMGIELVAGRDFARTTTADTSRGLLINAALADAMGWDASEAVGRSLPGMPDHEILGVTADFNFASLHQPVEPLVLAPTPDLVLRGAANVGIPGSTNPKIAIRIAPDRISEAMATIEQTWQAVAPAQPFRYTFLDDAVDSQYRQEQRFTQVVGAASGLAIIIAVFGLLGLAALVAQRRTKEIGIRKALGATVPGIVGLLSWEFVKVVAFAFVIAAPVAYLVMRQWLQDFAYHIELGPWGFLGAGALTLAVALLAVSYQALRAATVNPVRALRTE
jgi:putative ABC transport system permease protein